MPNGDQITQDFEFQIGDTLFGCGSNSVHLDIKPIEGLGVPDAKTQDVVWFGADGAYANPDYVSVRLITIPVVLKAVDADTVMNDLITLNDAWAPQVADIDLVIRLPGWGNCKVMGRPRGAKVDLEHLRRGVVRALLRFDCPDPTISFI